MEPEIGDIIDCRNVPSLEHFIVVLGIRKKNRKEEVMYYIITSRVYAVFSDILDFFNDCISEKYKRFWIKFPKEKGKNRINPHGNLCDAFFFDRKKDYDLCLDQDSMIVVNKEPDLIDKITLDQLIQNKLAKYRIRLTEFDLARLIQMIKLSKNVGPENTSNICVNYNIWKKALLSRKVLPNA